MSLKRRHIVALLVAQMLLPVRIRVVVVGGEIRAQG